MSPSARLAFTVALVLAGWIAPAESRAAAERAKRELTTDRPDATESPFTVEPGHVQLEMDFANYTVDRTAGTRASSWEILPFNLRFGVAPDLEVGVFAAPFGREDETPPTGPGARRYGFGDLTARVKLNLWGNDSGKTAFGAIADLKLPTGSGGLGNGKFEGAVAFPLAFSLAGGWESGAMTSLAFVHDGTGYQAVWGNSVTFGHAITPAVGGYLELTSATGDGSHVATFNCGLLRAFGRDTQLDCGISLGLSRRAPDIQLFAGLSQRF